MRTRTTRSTPRRLPPACRALLFAMALLLAACGPYPRDPEGTTGRVQHGVLRVGAIHDPPFVRVREGAEPTGPEADMVRALAQSLDARVQWTGGGSDELLEQLEDFRLDMVVGGVSEHSPWRGRVALGLPYLATGAHGRLQQRVTALPPGENRWQMRVERFQRTPRARTALQGATGAMAGEPAR